MRMGPEDPTFRDDLGRRVAEGLTPEMSGASRRRFALLQGAIILGLGLIFVSTLAVKGPASAQTLLSTTALVVVVTATVWRYRRLSPQPGHSFSDGELSAVANRSYRCTTCRTIVLPGETECPQCGGLKHPRWALAFGIMFGVAMTALALWRAGGFGG